MTLALVPKPASDAEFLAVFNRLCVALRETQDDSGITQSVYWDALKDLPIEALDAGAVALSREAGRRFFPTTAEWRTAAERAATDTLRKALHAPREEPWHHECRECEDSGWLTAMSCPGDSTCGRRKAHRPHEYTQACPCRLTNRTYRRNIMHGGGAS